jgi:hypothetical protein
MLWHDGVPLWDCLTGLRELEIDEDMFGGKIEYMGYELSVQRLTQWLYKVRQVVALFHSNPAKWKATSSKFLDIHDVLCGRQPDPPWTQRSDSGIVEAIIELIGKAIEHHLGDVGNYSGDLAAENNEDYDKGSPYGFFRFSILG